MSLREYHEQLFVGSPEASVFGYDAVEKALLAKPPLQSLASQKARLRSALSRNAEQSQGNISVPWLDNERAGKVSKHLPVSPMLLSVCSGGDCVRGICIMDLPSRTRGPTLDRD